MTGPNFRKAWWGMILLLPAAALTLAACAPLMPNAPTTTNAPAPTATAVFSSIPEDNYPEFPADLRFEKISVDQGLSQSTVRAVLQDRTGFIWLATEDGLNKHDGHGFTVYKHDPENPGSLSSSNISTLLEDHEGTLWVGTDDGLNRLDRETGQFEHFLWDRGRPGTLSNGTINDIAEDAQGTLWIATGGGLNRYDPETGAFEHYLHVPGDGKTLALNLIRTVVVDRSGNVWVGTREGLDRLDPATGVFTHYQHDPNNPDSLGGSQVRALFIDHLGVLWVGTDKGLDRFDREVNRFVHFRHDPAKPGTLNSDWINAIYMDEAGTLWVGLMDGGLCRTKSPEAGFQCYQYRSEDHGSLSVDHILDIYQDRAGALWIGTYAGGANRVDAGYKVFNHYWRDPLSRYLLSDNHVFALWQDPDEILWVGTDDGGLDRIDRKTGAVQNYRNEAGNPASLSWNNVEVIYRDRTGVLWIGTTHGLNRMNEQSGTFTQFFQKPGQPDTLSSDVITSILEDREGALWIGTSGGGLNRLDRASGKFTHFAHVQRNEGSLADNYVSALFLDREGVLWVGTTYSGLDRYSADSGQFIHYPSNPEEPNALSSPYVLSIFQDHSGAIWAGTTGGLNRLDGSTGFFQQYRVKNGLPNDYIYAIREDEQGYLWMSTNKGIARMDPATGTFKNYDAQDGLQSNEFNVGAVFQKPDGELIFGGINGITTFHPDSIRDNPYLPPVVLTSLTRHGEPLTGLAAPDTVREITLRWPDNYFDFEFSALDYTRPEQNQYAYKLEGFDRDWNVIERKHSGTYTNLPGGTYTLRLKGANNDGLWNETGSAIKVTVVPPFWQTLWFRIGAGLAVVLLAGGGIQLRVREMARRNQQLEQQVQQRTAEIEQHSRQMEALYRAGEYMQRLLALEKVLDTLVDAAVDMLGAEKCAVFAWDRENEWFVLQGSRGFSEETRQKLDFPACNNLLGRTALQGQPVAMERLDGRGRDRWQAECPEMAQAFRAEGIRSFMHLPLTVGQEVFGVLHASYTRPEAFDRETLRLFEALAQRGALSIENAKLLEQTKELVVVEERSRLARDLHDSAKQKAFAALAQLGAAEGLVKASPDQAATHLEEAETLVYDVIQELTFLIQEMYPMALKEKGLANVLRDYAFEWENRTDIPVNLEIRDERRLPLEIEQAFYRIAQESLANIQRHSKARQVDMQLAYSADCLQLTVRDDGLGFDPARKPAGIGLRSMQERITGLRGKLEIHSAPGQGTTLQAQAPLNSKHLVL